MKILLDTNSLVHAYNKSAPNQKQASKILLNWFNAGRVKRKLPSLLVNRSTTKRRIESVLCEAGTVINH